MTEIAEIIAAIDKVEKNGPEGVSLHELSTALGWEIYQEGPDRWRVQGSPAILPREDLMWKMITEWHDRKDCRHA